MIFKNVQNEKDKAKRNKNGKFTPKHIRMQEDNVNKFAERENQMKKLK